jgi:NACalpha-BTF3-like transcription factor
MSKDLEHSSSPSSATTGAVDNNNAASPQAPAAAAQPKHDSGAADLEKVTDYAEEKEITNDLNLNQAINAISDKRKKDADLKAEREKQLALVKIKKEDVELLCVEFEIAKSKSERVLKENNGDLKAALSSLLEAL